MEEQKVVNPSLVAKDVHFSYGAREVLHGVGISLKPGKIHALLGANGSGKSTLVKVLTGRVQAGSGDLQIGDVKKGAIRSPGDAYAAGIRAVQQETPLIDKMSITENVAIRTSYPTGLFGRVKWKVAHQRTGELLARLGLDLDPMAKAASVSASDRGLLTIGIALSGDPSQQASAHQILILDEATAAIPEKDAFEVLQKVRQLADEGLSVLIVTHRVSEVTEFADDLTVLYDGNVVYQDTAKVDPEQIVELIVTGKTGAASATAMARDEPREIADDRAVVIEDLRGEYLDGVSFHVNSGEILGIVGGPQSGASEISDALAGLLPSGSGTISIGGQSEPLPRNPRQAIKRGICLVPRDRLRHGAIGVLSVFENVLLPNARGAFFNTARHRALVDDVIDEFTVTPPEPKYKLRELSGGNQQKVIVGKWLARHPKLLILDDPTIGVDPGARKIMFDVVVERCRKEGLCVLLLSSEPEELAQHCDRLIAIDGGKIADELTGARADRLTISTWASK